MESLGERLRIRREANGLSQTDLAQKTGVSQARISQWERGSQPSREQIEKLDSILGEVLQQETTASQGSSAVGAWLRGGFLGEVLQQETTASQGSSAVGAWLSKARLNADLTVNELATKAGVSAATIYNLENGRAENPHPRTIKALEQALGNRLESEQQVKEASEIKGLGEFVDFDPYDVKNLPDIAGVYVFYDISQRPIYVGQGGSIARRIKDHAEKFWFKRPIVEDGAYVEIADKRLREQVETILIRFLKQNAVINRNKVDRG